MTSILFGSLGSAVYKWNVSSCSVRYSVPFVIRELSVSTTTNKTQKKEAYRASDDDDEQLISG